MHPICATNKATRTMRTYQMTMPIGYKAAFAYEAAGNYAVDHEGKIRRLPRSWDAPRIIRGRPWSKDSPAAQRHSNGPKDSPMEQNQSSGPKIARWPNASPQSKDRGLSPALARVSTGSSTGFSLAKRAIMNTRMEVSLLCSTLHRSILPTIG